MDFITKLGQFKELQSNTYVLAIIVMAVAFLVALLIANFIPWGSGNDKSHVTRRILWIIIGFFGAAGFYLYNYFAVRPRIKNIGWTVEFSKQNLLCIAITVGGYVLLSLIVMLIFRRTKFGSILGKTKK